jgi:hypothetical protein
MNSKPRLLSIHRTQERAIRSRAQLPSEWERRHAWVELGPAGSTADKPWGVLAPAAKKESR